MHDEQEMTIRDVARHRCTSLVAPLSLAVLWALTASAQLPAEVDTRWYSVHVRITGEASDRLLGWVLSTSVAGVGPTGVHYASGTEFWQVDRNVLSLGSDHGFDHLEVTHWASSSWPADWQHPSVADLHARFEDFIEASETPAEWNVFTHLVSPPWTIYQGISPTAPLFSIEDDIGNVVGYLEFGPSLDGTEMAELRWSGTTTTGFLVDLPIGQSRTLAAVSAIPPGFVGFTATCKSASFSSN